MNNIEVEPSHFKGKITLSPSKSHSIRAVIFSSLASGSSHITGLLSSPDVEKTIKACRLLGAKIEKNGQEIHVEGVAGKPCIPEDVIDSGNSGQVLRFIGAIASLIEGYTVITGDASVRSNRPVKPLIEGINGLNGEAFSTRNNDLAPIIIKGPIRPGKVSIDGKDSQPLSGLLMASAFLKGRTEINVTNVGEIPWLGLTLDWFDKLKIQYEHKDYTRFIMQGNASYNGFNYHVPGDFSSIAYPIVASIITNSEIKISNVDMEDIQGDKMLVNMLIEMGAKIEIDNEKKSLKVLKGSSMVGRKIDINPFIDGITIFAVMGCFAKGKTEVYNGLIARKKECDRIHSICLELKKMGAKIEEKEDGFIVYESDLKGVNDLKTYHDHRMVMSLAVAAFAASGKSTIENINCVKKSYPAFVEDMTKLNGKLEIL